METKNERFESLIDLQNSMKVVDRFQWHTEVRCDVLNRYLNEIISSRHEITYLKSELARASKAEDRLLATTEGIAEIIR